MPRGIPDRAPERISALDVSQQGIVFSLIYEHHDTTRHLDFNQVS